jgi:hypothetical protein
MGCEILSYWEEGANGWYWKGGEFRGLRVRVGGVQEIFHKSDLEISLIFCIFFQNSF